MNKEWIILKYGSEYDAIIKFLDEIQLKPSDQAMTFDEMIFSSLSILELLDSDLFKSDDVSNNELTDIILKNIGLRAIHDRIKDRIMET